MFSEEIRKLLVQVISSWQVITVTIVLIIYVALVKYVAKVYHSRPNRILIPKIKRKKKTAGETPDAQGTGDSEDLGLEEAE